MTSYSILKQHRFGPKTTWRPSTVGTHKTPSFTRKSAILSKSGRSPYSYPWNIARGRKVPFLLRNWSIKPPVLWGKTQSINLDKVLDEIWGLDLSLFCEGCWRLFRRVIVRVFWVFEWGSSSRFAPPMGFPPHTRPPYGGGPPEGTSSALRPGLPAHPLDSPWESSWVERTRFNQDGSLFLHLLRLFTCY